MLPVQSSLIWQRTAIYRYFFNRHASMRFVSEKPLSFCMDLRHVIWKNTYSPQFTGSWALNYSHACAWPNISRLLSLLICQLTVFIEFIYIIVMCLVGAALRLKIKDRAIRSNRPQESNQTTPAASFTYPFTYSIQPIWLRWSFYRLTAETVRSGDGLSIFKKWVFQNVANVPPRLCFDLIRYLDLNVG